MADALGFPDANDTGVVAGTTLTLHKGDLVISTPGAVIQNLDIQGTVYINANNVTLINCNITSTGYDCVNVKTGVTGTTVENCEINGTGKGPQGQSGIGGSGTFIGNNIYNVENGINVEGSNTVIQNNYIHDLNASGGSAGHYDGIAIQGGFNNVLVQHNTVLGRDTSCVFIDNDFGPMNNITVNDNKLLGQDDAAYTIYVIEKAGNPAQITNVQVTNNYLGKGWAGYVSIDSTQPVWTNNVDYTTDKVISQDNTLSSPTSPTSHVAISAFSTDSGVVGDHITNDSTPTLTGTAAANSTVTVSDGTKVLGTTTANSSGTWTYTPKAALADGTHSFTASAGGAASTTFTLAIDTLAPTAPVISADTVNANNTVSLAGNAGANSTVTIFDGTKVLGTPTADSSGAWNYTTVALTIGTHSLTATATDAAGNTSAASQTVGPVIPTMPTAPAPAIASFSTDSGVVGDHITNDSTPTLTGTAAANSTVTVSDGTKVLGTTTANGSGTWTYTPKAALADGTHSFTASAGGAASTDFHAGDRYGCSDSTCH